MNRFTKRATTITVALAVALGSASAAYAYWPGASGGSTSADPDALLFANQISVIGAMGPGVAAQSLRGTFTNLNAHPIYISTVTAAIGSIKGAGVGAGTCEATDFTLTNAASTVGREVPTGASVGAWGDLDAPTIQFNNKADENQDDCKNVTVQLAYTIA